MSKSLMIRLSSLGDLVLASSALTVDSIQETDWLTASPYDKLLLGHSKVKHVHVFNRRQNSALLSWVQLCRKLWVHGYSDIYDFHVNYRTVLMSFLFFIWDCQQKFFSGTQTPKHARWWRVSKQRNSSQNYLVFKSLLPKSWRPKPWTEQFTRLVGGSGQEKPDLSFLLKKVSFKTLPKEVQGLIKQDSPFFCVMPSSQHPGKRWTRDAWVQLIRNRRRLPSYGLPIILGQVADSASQLLVQDLVSEGIAHLSLIQKLDLAQTAFVLKHAQLLIAIDTGLGHLAEAMGTRAYIVFGPTSGDLGFAPWRVESCAIEKSLACRPCSKSGNFCYRVLQPYYCMKQLLPQYVEEQLDVHERGFPLIYSKKNKIF